MSDPSKTIHAQLADMVGLINEKLENGGSAAFSPKGASMLPMLRVAGDSVTLVKPPARLKKGMVALFISEGEGGESRFLLHRLVRVKGSSLTFCGDNRKTCDPPARHEDVIGVVSEYESRGRRHRVTEPLYRLYSAWMVITFRFRSLSLKVQKAVYKVWKKLKKK